MKTVCGGIEGGGTKFVVMLGTGPGEVIDELRFPTTTPEESLGRAVEFLARPREGVRLGAVGVSMFGPIDLQTGSPTYGYVTTTPKPGWPYTDVVGYLHKHLEVPIGWDTDVNGAALGEHRWGAGQGADPLVYITVGTGVGGGALVNGQPVHGLLHPEMGHLRLPQVPGDTFAGVCPYHGNCLEGMICGPALFARAGRPAQELAIDDPIWETVAQYLAYGLLNIILVVSPQRIIVGGGVASQPALLPAVRRHLADFNNGYVNRVEITGAADDYIVAPGLGGEAGVLGAIELARLAHARSGQGVL